MLEVLNKRLKLKNVYIFWIKPAIKYILNKLAIIDLNSRNYFSCLLKLRITFTASKRTAIDFLL